jgi:hypothetical protein
MKFFEVAALLGLVAATAHSAFAPTPDKNPHCGDASWSIVSLKNGNAIFNGKAECTTIEGTNTLLSVVGPENTRLSLWVRFDATGSSTCGQDDRVEVTLAGVPGPAANPNYSATGRELGPTRCNFDISDLPRNPGFVRGGLTAVVGRCPFGGCGKPSDMDLVSVNGSFDAYSRGR